MKVLKEKVVHDVRGFTHNGVGDNSVVTIYKVRLVQYPSYIAVEKVVQVTSPSRSGLIDGCVHLVEQGESLEKLTKTFHQVAGASYMNGRCF